MPQHIYIFFSCQSILHTYSTTLTNNFDLYVNLSSIAGNKSLSFDYINTGGTDKMDVLLSTDGGATFPTTLLNITTAAAWTAKQ